MDADCRAVHKTEKGETLRQIAGRYVQFRGEGMESEWKAIYGLNSKAIVEGWKRDGQPAQEAKGDQPAQEAKPPTWSEAYRIDDPPAKVGDLDLEDRPLPAGLELVVYRRRVPRPWYGWCKLSGLRLDGEYCDPAKPAAEAFRVPEAPPFDSLRLRAKDFAAHPIRDISVLDMLEFAEWCGCHLPSEYEWERAGRGDNLKDQFTFGKWDHSKQKTLFPWADNPRRDEAPFRVDDQQAQPSDSPFGARMMHGNVWEQTRTFFDLHPKRTPRPPDPVPDSINYALVAKGGSYGDRWALMQISVRADKIGGIETMLTLDSPNRADSLGLRLVRHPQPGRDLMMHAVLHLTYDTGRGGWIDPNLVPLCFALDRTAAAEHFHARAAEAPYVHFERKAETVAFTPLYFTDLDEARFRKTKTDWDQGKGTPGSYALLGALRCDVPLLGGLRLTKTEEEALLQARKFYDDKKKKWDDLTPAKRKGLLAPEKPANYEPDAYEKLTHKNSAAGCGLWREGEIKPGTYYVVFWNGFLALTNKAKTMPPDAIFPIESLAKSVTRKRRAAKTPIEGTSLALDEAKDRIGLVFQMEEQVSDLKKRKAPPSQRDSEWWALCEVQPERWTGGTEKDGFVWTFEVALTAPAGTLKAWNTKGGQARAAAPRNEGAAAPGGTKIPAVPGGAAPTGPTDKEDGPK
jgi:hypothetical protein